MFKKKRGLMDKSDSNSSNLRLNDNGKIILIEGIPLFKNNNNFFEEWFTWINAFATRSIIKEFKKEYGKPLKSISDLKRSPWFHFNSAEDKLNGIITTINEELPLEREKQGVTNPEKMIVYRAIKKDDLTEIDFEKLGASWSWNSPSAIPYLGGVYEGKFVYVIIAEINKKDVDWKETIFLNMEPFYGVEEEIYVPDNTSINIINILKYNPDDYEEYGEESDVLKLFIKERRTLDKLRDKEVYTD
jgi:hypothetical protein